MPTPNIRSVGLADLSSCAGARAGGVGCAKCMHLGVKEKSL
jgi:hypothetical protein